MEMHGLMILCHFESTEAGGEVTICIPAGIKGNIQPSQLLLVGADQGVAMIAPNK
jgi:hypothetical protein